MSNKTYGPQPKSFSLGDGERYYIGADVGQYLRFHRGTLYKRYPQLWKRFATQEEKKKIQEIGVATSCVSSNIMLVKANEVEEIFEGNEDKYRSGGSAVSVSRVDPSNSVKKQALPWLSQQVRIFAVRSIILGEQWLPSSRIGPVLNPSSAR